MTTSARALTLLCAMLVVATPLLSGCTLFGLGIGAYTDLRSRSIGRDELPLLDPGTPVEVRASVPQAPGVEQVTVERYATGATTPYAVNVEERPSPRFATLPTLEAAFAGVDANRLAVRTDSVHWLLDPRTAGDLATIEPGGRTTIPLSSVREVIAQRSSGGWWKGLLIGLAIDVAVVASFVAFVCQGNCIGAK